jgi:hypothetical protein
VIAGSLVCAGCTDEPLPKVAQVWQREAPELVPPSPPGFPVPKRARELSQQERFAIEQLRRRGASVWVFSDSGDTLVDFALGAKEREWRKSGVPAVMCGMSLDLAVTPDDTGPEMTDKDLHYLALLPHLTRLNVDGTRVTAAALDAFVRAHPDVEIEHDADDQE